MLCELRGINTAVFIKHIIAFHQTFAAVGEKNKNKEKNISDIWHEGIAGRKAKEIVAAFMKAIKHEHNRKYFIWWMNNCGGQNKNWMLYTMLVSLVTSSIVDAKEITLKYFESVHMFMRADPVHYCNALWKIKWCSHGYY